MAVRAACLALLLVAAADECGIDPGAPSRSSAEDILAVGISTGDSDAALRLVNASLSTWAAALPAERLVVFSGEGHERTPARQGGQGPL